MTADTIEMKLLDRILDHIVERSDLLAKYLDDIKNDDPDKKLKEMAGAGGMVELKILLNTIKEKLVLEKFER